MRPERKAPENLPDAQSPMRMHACFNEAGAKSPGEPSAARTIAAAKGRGFNEAGAKSPGERRRADPGGGACPCFNEAGAKSPGEPGSDGALRRKPRRASMRPERKAPENRPFAIPDFDAMQRLQ